ncbi:uncharacterized protein LOC125942610 [Dermacentor silvarum]|uniref:uncharacterized protein LOC125942610 n=1 Tax=Dermacentor silvarum TaxID=543639 RepID=UPI002100B786|nr:uncharacterized protein LOC125942610 [Dermacentor silvarum]XP_049516752.1 uncharacterized protein LOC125942610 [Dermacentor silvarum]
MRDVKTVKHQNERLLAALSIPNENGEMGVANCNLPLGDMENLATLESRLSSDPALRTHLIRRLSLIGGRDLRSLTAGILRAVFTDDLGAKFSTLGQRQKKSLRDLHVYSVIEEAIRSDPMCASATTHAIRQAAAAWLKNCSLRAAKRHQKNIAHSLVEHA